MEKHIRESKFISWVLRHDPGGIGLSLDCNGWAGINELIECASRKGIILDKGLIFEIAETDSKGRYQISADRQRIRAVYGHSRRVKLDLEDEKPPPALYHGTASRNLDSIMKNGINPQTRQYVHLSSDPETAMEVGRRHGKVILLEVDSASMYRDGMKFCHPAEKIWLTDGVQPGYIRIGYHPVQHDDS
ncbi:MAG: RNA 2'-phosphotransferase [Candidatus Krumholzibacteriales bacterium]